MSGLDIGNFRTLQKVNRIVIPERKLPSEAEVAKREAERLAVEIEHHLRAVPERDRQAREETHLPTVESLAATPQGRRLLSAVLFEYLEHRHVATPAREDGTAEPAVDTASMSADEARRHEPPRRRDGGGRDGGGRDGGARDGRGGGSREGGSDGRRRRRRRRGGR